MCRFIDGPAAGVALQLRRAPVLLRVVRDRNTGNFDALDQLDDAPEPWEEITVYVAVTDASRFHLLCRGRGRVRSGGTGWYETRDYMALPNPPADDAVRDNAAWQKWAAAFFEIMKRRRLEDGRGQGG